MPDLRPTTLALLNAVWHADLNLTRRLLAAHPLDVNAAVDRQNTLLFFAARVPGYNGHGDAPTTDDANELVRVEIIDLLVSLGADVNVHNQRKVTPLHMAARYGLPLVAAALLRHGADANARDVNHETPLYRAANLGYPSVARVLLHHGADPRLTDRSGQTPLHRAALKGNRDLADLLLSHGADPHAADKQGKTPSALAPPGMSGEAVK